MPPFEYASQMSALNTRQNYSFTQKFPSLQIMSPSRSLRGTDCFHVNRVQERSLSQNKAVKEKKSTLLQHQQSKPQSIPTQSEMPFITKGTYGDYSQLKVIPDKASLALQLMFTQMAVYDFYFKLIHFNPTVLQWAVPVYRTTFIIPSLCWNYVFHTTNPADLPSGQHKQIKHLKNEHWFTINHHLFSNCDNFLLQPNC